MRRGAVVLRFKKTLVLVGLLSVATLIYVLYSGTKSGPSSGIGMPSRYSVFETNQVWDEKFSQLLTGGLYDGKFGYTKIQERFDLQRRLIQERHHRGVLIKLSQTYNPRSQDDLVECWIENGQPRVDIIIPRLVDLYYQDHATDDKRWLTRLQNEFIVRLMHELDHLAFGLVSESRDHVPTPDEIMDREANAWAETCEYMIRPLVEEYHAPLDDSSLLFYHQWIDGGQDRDGKYWRDFIRSEYLAVKDKKDNVGK